jgi:hypothetical protein
MDRWKFKLRYLLFHDFKKPFFNLVLIPEVLDSGNFSALYDFFYL